MKKLALLANTFLLLAVPSFAQSAQPQDGSMDSFVNDYLFPASEADFQKARQRLSSDSSLRNVSRIAFEDFEEAMRSGHGNFAPAPAVVSGKIPLEEILIPVREGISFPVLVQLPTGYHPDVAWPLMWAMHGGPPATADQARKGAERMIKVWQDAANMMGWIVAAPALVTSISVDKRTEERLPYQILHPEIARELLDALRKKYNINPDRIVSTGISLGSNFSLGFGCAHPDWFSSIVPVSTEGEKRALLLRNLNNLPTYILEGSLDKNVRTITGPRTLASIVDSFGYDLNYREFDNHAHESFQSHYPDVLRWLDDRPRHNFPREIIRSPHSAIMPVARRLFWMEADTRQALLRARVTSPTRIDITARWARNLKVYLSDHVVNLDSPIDVWINGVRVFSAKVPRSIPTALEQARELQDEARVYAAVVDLKVPQTAAAMAEGRRLAQEFHEDDPQELFSFWETYATRALRERFPDVGFRGTEAVAPSAAGLSGEEVAIRVDSVKNDSAIGSAGLCAGDLVLTVGGEPFYRGRGGVDGLHSWLMRELRDEPTDYRIVVWRGGRRTTLTAHFQLGPYDHVEAAGQHN